ncbi:MAG: aminotransferase class I/II-fold pyridoxal phosphate-dependent enzyme [Bacteroidales bacterium]|nr:aminotransferase class I/II-fold pyridoxal phosphate-dependent enzyme [Bacteroidales bacterium]
MNSKEFRNEAHRFVDWMADYLEKVEDFPVKSQVKPGYLNPQIPGSPPEKPELMQEIFTDFQKIILPGITHWQSPNFFAYFPANSSYPSVLAEMLTSTLATQCMIWETSPAAAELEEKMMNWLKQMTKLPAHFHGVIQDTASTATLVALLTARERSTDFKINKTGLENSKFRIYTSSQGHSSIDKAVKIAGFGLDNLVKVSVDDQFRLDTNALRQAVESDIKNGFKPLCVVATLGTTSSTAIDPIEEISKITTRFNIWLHVDAALAGTSLILEENRWMIKGIENVDSLVFNPHKWMFTNFDCSAYFVKDKDSLIRTFAISPEYLKTRTQGQVNDYRDWGIQLGRRFRALKLWFVIRSFGVEGLKKKIAYHIELAKNFESKIIESVYFEMLAPRTLNLVCFRFKLPHIQDETILNQINEKLLNAINSTGKIYLTHTKLNEKYTLRMVIGQTNVAEKHVEQAWEIINDCAARLVNELSP